jgi:anti-sigma regulatory factor (Ser/Thr protein kinase)
MKGARGRAYKRVRHPVFFPIKTKPTALSAGLPAPVNLNLLRHELRTPLAGLLGLAEMMSAMELPGRAPYLLATLQACGQQMAKLIDRSLRPEQIATPAKYMTETHSRELLEQVISSHRPAADAARVKLHLILQLETLGWWRVDPVALRQALDNLIANAIRFTYSGYVTLEARALPGAADGLGSLLLVVEDTGTGMQRVESNLQDHAEFADRTYPMPSRGQGLLVVERVCHDHGGLLERYTNAAGGAGFAMMLPDVIRGQYRINRQFQPGLFKKLRCKLLLHYPMDRVVMAMLGCLEISFEVVDTGQGGDIAGFQPGYIAICNPSKMPENNWGLDHCPDSASLWLVAPLNTTKGTEHYVQQLPEPLLQADLQIALLRCLVMQAQVTGLDSGLDPGLGSELTAELPAKGIQQSLE